MTDLDRILVVNAGSSSLKLRLLDAQDRLVSMCDVETRGGKIDGSALGGFLSEVGSIDAFGHRVVHGGSLFSGPALLDSTALERLRSLTDLAPLHQTMALAAVETLMRLRPGTPAIACFDTTFHASLPVEASTYALPADLRQRFGLKRFGFHGLSHAYAGRRCAQLLGRPPEQLRIVSCHLGSGASLAAIRGGRSVDTTMGFTPMEGLIMATRSGTVDPGLLLWLIERAGVSASELSKLLDHSSGLLGLCGKSDMREVVVDARAGKPDSRLALDAYVHRLRSSVSAMAASMEGLDALVFTGGVGENSSEVRGLACSGLAFLGVGIDPAKNEAAVGDRDISAGDAYVRTLVIAAREDLEIARQVRSVLGGQGEGADLDR